MAEKKLEDAILDYIDALEKKNMQKALAFYSDDASWYSIQGTFKGKKRIRKYLEWLFESVTDLRFKDDGIGLISQGNRAVYQHRFTGTANSMKIEVQSVSTYEFIGNRCVNHWSVSDRLPIATRALNGLIARNAAHSIQNRMEQEPGCNPRRF